MRELDNTSDFPPTEQQRQVADALKGRLEDAVEAYNRFLETDLAELNELCDSRV